MTYMPRVGSQKTRKSSGPNFDYKLFGGIAAIGLITIAGSFFLARSDSGEINVAATITTSNQERAESGDTTAPTPVPKNNDKPFGGLISTGKEEPPKPKPEPEVEGSATTTDAATSTEEATSTEGGETTEPEATETTTEETPEAVTPTE